ncbi:TspO/MBR family protein [uncultured Microscilla sp.]|uniref:TspO/MBR family protein n=1 Tax=uncultured Microscilla sp. TaxID=432653 RepID=UPI00261E76A9|nr:TspO/MBR family protein [uncultured Microscilla sp.]
MAYRLIIFLLINFAALALGAMFTGKGVPSEWYINLNKAPWTPPGWVFGAAWTTIMVCLAIYMAYAWRSIPDRKLLIGLFALQWVLNVLWNPVFFAMHQVALGLIIISLLTVLVGYFLIGWFPYLKAKALLVLPYFVWLLIATSLNAYILLKN